MKKIILVLSLLLLSFSAAFGGASAKQITGGKFLITGASGDTQNASLISKDFSVLSHLGGGFSNWADICSPCRFGQTFTVPRGPRVDLGAQGTQFNRGTLTIAGNTYQDVYFSGAFFFSQESFFIPHTARKGTLYLRKPFQINGTLKVCAVSESVSACPKDKILFNSQIAGHGTLTAALTISDRNFSSPLLSQKTFEYQFEE